MSSTSFGLVLSVARLTAGQPPKGSQLTFGPTTQRNTKVTSSPVVDAAPFNLVIYAQLIEISFILDVL